MLGQTATADDGGGWRNDSAQSRVRQDILDADCRMIESTLNNQFIQHWKAFNAPNITDPIEFNLFSTPPEDEKIALKTQKLKAEITAIYINAGLLDVDENLKAQIRTSIGQHMLRKSQRLK